MAQVESGLQQWSGRLDSLTTRKEASMRRPNLGGMVVRATLSFAHRLAGQLLAFGGIEKMECGLARRLACFVVLLVLLGGNALGQETTGGLQGTVKDPSGAVVQNARVEVTASTLVGNKVIATDATGYYRFANLPPGDYTVTVTAQGFETT